jgi:hypothetical protein
MRTMGFSRLAIFSVSAVLCATMGSAQTCQIVGVSVGGFYSYSAIGNGLPGSLLAGTGTSATGTSGSTTGSSGSTTATASGPTYSNTELGKLLAGIAGTSPFASSGLFFLDGSGNVFASASPQGLLTTLVGSYVLNSDCTITVMLTDAFGTSNAAATSLQGIVLNNGAEIDFGVVRNVASGGTSTGTSSGASGLYESSVLIKLVRPLAATCASSELFGPYALIGTGMMVASTSSAQTEAPFFLFSLVQFDGNGNVISPSGTPSTLGGNLRFTGTYTVNADCTGTMTLSNAPGTITGATGSSSATSSSTLSLSFIVTPPTVPYNSASTTAVRSTGPEIEFSQSSGSATLFGYGIAQ